MAERAAPFLEVEDVHASYPITRGSFVQQTIGRVRAVDGVSLAVGKSEAVGLVGESGCGKTTLARVVVQLLRPDSGRVLLEGRDVAELRGAERKELRRRLQLVFQDPYDSLDARMTVGDIVGEGLAIHGLSRGGERRRRIAELLEKVHLRPEAVSRYPREFSGGQRQRIAIARALAVEPEVVVLDEPVSALDVSVQAQILNLLDELRRRDGLTYLFVSHDLAVVRHVCTRIAVMYLGKIVELGTTEQVIGHPLQPYTQALLSAVPPAEPDGASMKERILLGGDLPSPLDPPAACPVHTRCPLAEEVCRTVEPPLEEKEDGHWAACHFVERGPEGAAAPHVPSVPVARV
ncbi:MAG: ABC transporter ATP-binding protein [Gaiellaceae bacterium]